MQSVANEWLGEVREAFSCAEHPEPQIPVFGTWAICIAGHGNHARPPHHDGWVSEAGPKRELTRDGAMIQREVPNRRQDSPRLVDHSVCCTQNIDIRISAQKIDLDSKTVYFADIDRKSTRLNSSH